MKHAQLPSGEILEFPDETRDSVIDATVRKHLKLAPEVSGPPTPDFIPERDQLPLPDGSYAKPAVATDEVREQASQWGPKLKGYLKQKAGEFGAYTDEMDRLDQAGASKMGAVEGMVKGGLDTALDMAIQAGSSVRHLAKGALAASTGEGRIPTIGEVAKGIRDDTEAMKELRTPDSWKEYQKKNPIVAEGEKLVPGMLSPFTDLLDYSRKKYGDETADTLEVAMAASPLALMFKGGKGPKAPNPKDVVPDLVKDVGESLDPPTPAKEALKTWQEAHPDSPNMGPQRPTFEDAPREPTRVEVVDPDAGLSSLEKALKLADEGLPEARPPEPFPPKEVRDAPLPEDIVEPPMAPPREIPLPEPQMDPHAIKPNPMEGITPNLVEAPVEAPMAPREPFATRPPEPVVAPELVRPMEPPRAIETPVRVDPLDRALDMAHGLNRDVVNTGPLEPTPRMGGPAGGPIPRDAFSQKRGQRGSVDSELLRDMAGAPKVFAKSLLPEPDRVLSQMLRGTGKSTGGELLTHIGEKSVSPILKHVAKILEPTVRDIPVILKDAVKDQKGKDLMGAYYYDTNHIEISAKYGVRPEVLVHELVHGAISNFIRLDPNHPSVKAMGLLHNHFKAQMEQHPLFGIKYAATNLHEFIAQALSDEATQTHLASIKVQGGFLEKISQYIGEPSTGKLKNLWDVLKQAVNYALDINKGDLTVLDQVMRATTKALAEKVPDAKAQDTVFIKRHIKEELGLTDMAQIDDVYNKTNADPLESKGKNNQLGLETPNNFDVAKDENGLVKIDQVTAHRSTADFLKENKDALLKTIKGLPEDIAHRIGMSSASYRSMTGMISHAGNIAYKIANHVTETISRYSDLENYILHPWKNIFNDTIKNYVNRAEKANGFGSFKKDMKTMLDLEKDPASWGGGQNNKWWPSIQDMVAKGMDPVSAKLWERIGIMQDGVWKILDATAKMTNRPLPDRIPGHIPHMFRGQFAVKITLINDKDPTDIRHQSSYNYHSEREATPYRDEAMKQVDGKKFQVGNDWFTAKVEFDKPQVGGRGAAAELEALWSAADKMPIPALAKALDNIFDSQAMGLITHAMDRNHVNMKGHIFERLNEQGMKGLSKAEVKEAISGMEKYVEAVVGWHVRAKWATEVLLPMKEHLVTRPELTKFTMDSMNAFFRAPNMWTKSLTAPIEKLLLASKMDPLLIHDIKGQLSSAISLFYLIGNMPYYIANINQILLTPSVLLLNKARIQELTGKSVSVTKAMADHATQGSGMRQGLKNAAEAWGYSDPVLVEHMMNRGWMDPIALRIDKFTRETSFNAAYHMARQIMNQKDAIEYAGRVSKEVSVPYGGESGAPLAFGKLGAMRLMTTFMTYSQHMLGMHHNQVSMMWNAKNGAAKANALGSLVGVIGLQTMLYGIAGVPFMQNYDQIAFWAGKWFNKAFPSSKEIARYGDKALSEHVGTEISKDLLTFGLASKYQTRAASLGYLGDMDLSGSGSGANISMSTVALKTAQTVIDATLLAEKTGHGFLDPTKAPTKKEIGEWVKTLPTLSKTTTNLLYLNNDKFSDVVKFAMDLEGAKPVHRPNYREPTKNGEVIKNPQEVRITLFGGSPLEQRQGEITEQVIARKEAVIRNKLDHLEQLAKEAPATKKEFFIQELAKLRPETGLDVEAVTRAVMKFEKEKQLSPEARQIINLSPTLKGIRDKERRDAEAAYQPQKWR